MRRILISLVICGGVVGAASACTDTLSLSGLRQFDLSFKNVRSDRWDSVDIDIRQSGKARALSMQPSKDTSKLSLPVQFRSNCGSDSTSEVSYLELRNVAYTERGNDYWRDTSRVYTANAKVESFPAGVDYDGVMMKGFWTVGDVQIGKLNGESPKVYHIQCIGFRHKTGGGYMYSRFNTLYRAERASAMASVDQMVGAFANGLDSVGKGLDSVRVSVRLTESVFSYDPTAWAIATGVRSRALRSQAFAGYRTSGGYSFVLPRPAQLSIFSPEGAVVRTIPASSAPTWDGRDAAGHRVKRGVYLVRAMGLGVLSIAAP